ncbi:hypothetical protein pb186bvf_000536 [Paramecium bursaria]
MQHTEKTYYSSVRTNDQEMIQNLKDELKDQHNFLQKQYTELISQKDNQIKSVEEQNLILKLDIKNLNYQKDLLQEEKLQLERKISKINNNLRTEECEKDELIREKELLRSHIQKNQLNEIQKLELTVQLKQQELEYCQNKIQKQEQQLQNYQSENEELLKQIGSYKYQLDNREMQFQSQIDQIQYQIIDYQDKLGNQSQMIEEGQQQIQQDQSFIDRMYNAIQSITNNNNDDLIDQIDMIRDQLVEYQTNENKFKLCDDEKSQVIFDLQHKYSDCQTTIQNLQTLLQTKEKLIQDMQTDIKSLEKAKKVFKSEYLHLKQLYDQKSNELKQQIENFKIFEDKMNQEINKTLKVESDNLRLNEDNLQLQQQIQQLKLGQTHKKSFSATQSIQDMTKQEYQALTMTFEKIKPLFSLQALELAQEMMRIQKQIVLAEHSRNNCIFGDSIKGTYDLKELIQEEIRCSQQIQLYQLSLQNNQNNQYKLQQENKKLKMEVQFKQQNIDLNQTAYKDLLTEYKQQKIRNNKQSLSVHMKPKII